jgi:hypothetical protein
MGTAHDEDDEDDEDDEADRGRAGRRVGADGGLHFVVAAPRFLRRPSRPPVRVPPWWQSPPTHTDASTTCRRHDGYMSVAQNTTGVATAVTASQLLQLHQRRQQSKSSFRCQNTSNNYSTQGTGGSVMRMRFLHPFTHHRRHHDSMPPERALTTVCSNFLDLPRRNTNSESTLSFCAKGLSL